MKKKDKPFVDSLYGVKVVDNGNIATDEFNKAFRSNRGEEIGKLFGAIRDASVELSDNYGVKVSVTVEYICRP